MITKKIKTVKRKPLNSSPTVPCSVQPQRVANMTNIPLTISLWAQETVPLFEHTSFTQLKANKQNTNALDMTLTVLASVSFLEVQCP